MPSLKAIRARIGSVKNTQKITRAMKMVSAAKLNRAQQAIIEARPYAQRLMQVLHDVALRAETQDHPLLARREPVQRTMLIVVTADRGLCGAFNANIIRRAERYIAEETAAGKEVSLGLVGRKGTDHFRRRRGNVEAKAPEALAEIREKKDISKELEERLVKLLDDFKELFQMDGGVAGARA